MASFSFDPRRGTARVFFRYGGKQYNRVEKAESERHAERLVALIEETISDLERGKLVMPDDADVKAFIATGGKVVNRPKPVSDPFHEPKPAALGDVFTLYRETLTKSHKAATSLSTERVHERHLIRLLGAKARFDQLDVARLQRYVDRRAKEGVVRDTIAKELGTLKAVWTWAARRKHVAIIPPWKADELTLPKGRQKPPFQTWDQIQRRISRGDLDADGQAELWESLWLDKPRMTACLEWVEANAPAPFLFPMFAFAAYTGARRSEMVRSERGDWDFGTATLRIRERKADRSRDFTIRDVSIHPRLAGIMSSWFASTPNGVYAIENDGVPLTIVQGTKWFRRTVDGGPWSVLRGWHVWRHSLASNMAAAGVDQRVVDATLGHTTDAMARRYRHLMPSKQADAIGKVFD